MGPTPVYGARAEKPLQNADFAMKQTNICRLSGDIMITHITLHYLLIAQLSTSLVEVINCAVLQGLRYRDRLQGSSWVVSGSSESR